MAVSVDRAGLASIWLAGRRLFVSAIFVSRIVTIDSNAFPIVSSNAIGLYAFASE
jgi:hypothetical protein